MQIFGLICSFHSIGFPCERGTVFSPGCKMDTVLFPFNWFPLREGNLFTPKMGILFTFPFNWFPLREGNSVLRGMAKREEFPFNWFPLREGNRGSVRPYRGLGLDVSIQLVSPARGELDRLNRPRLPQAKSVQSIGFPCERGTWHQGRHRSALAGFHSIGFPCERGTFDRIL